MFKGLIHKFVGDRKSRLMKRLSPGIAEVKEWADRAKGIADDDFPARTSDLAERLQNGETVDDIMSEAFGLVYEACRRHVGRSWDVVGHKSTWEMVPFDVQIAGSIALHEGSIVEMATGEGKTLVAVMPLYLNALTKKSSHLITVNDYLARRDAEWMGKIYEFLGLTVGYLQNEMGPEERKRVYSCDITYGTNNEFGFDYLRDNMKLSGDYQVQRVHHYAIVDEVDSVLIDEARTPLIISGPVPGSSKDENFSFLRTRVEDLVRKQKRMINDLMTKVEKAAGVDGEDDGDEDLGVNLLLARRGDPKNKRFMKMRKIPGFERMMLTTEAGFMREKRMNDLDEELFFVVDEKSNVVDLTEKGRNNLSKEDRELFVLPDLSIQIKEIDSDESLDPAEKIRKKDAAYRRYAEKSEVIHNFSQLMKAYTLFDKDIEMDKGIVKFER